MPGSREYPSAPIVGVGAVVIAGDCVLLVRRKQEPMRGQWAVPGGAVELGETLEEAIAREVAEETGLSVVPTMILKVLDRIERDAGSRIRFHYVLVDFLCVLNTPPPALCAATDVSFAAWAPLKMLRQSKEFPLPDWTLQVIELGQQQIAHEHPDIT